MGMQTGDVPATWANADLLKTLTGIVHRRISATALQSLSNGIGNIQGNDVDMKDNGVIGLGYVGLPLAVEFGKSRPVIGFDINQGRIDRTTRRARRNAGSFVRRAICSQ